MIRNNLKTLIDSQGITRYRFWKTTGLNRDTAYRLYNDPSYIPGPEVMDRIAEIYGWLPGAYLYYLPNPVSSKVSA